jgi:hypothetical protein
VSSGDNLRETDIEQASSQLNEGLKSCRAMVDNYRAMLTGERNGGSDDEEASDMSRYVSTTGSTSEAYGSSGAN